MSMAMRCCGAVTMPVHRFVPVGTSEPRARRRLHNRVDPNRLFTMFDEQKRSLAVCGVRV